MRKMFIFSVRDSALDAFLQPFFAPSEGIAMRSFKDEVQREESAMFKHPQDYELWHIGFFDEDSGVIEPCAKRALARGADMKEMG